MTPLTGNAFWRALLSEKYFDSAGQLLAPGYEYEAPPKDAQPIEAISSGVGRGKLTGGNLSLICALMGTPYEIQTDGRILFVEDTHEEPYRIDRFFSQLRLSGKLDHVAGVVLGVFNDCDTKTPGSSLTM